MISNVKIIGNASEGTSVYTKGADKVNNTSTLQAQEWNNMATAVALAHTKINSIITNGFGLDENDNANINAQSEINCHSYNGGEINVPGKITLYTTDTPSVNIQSGDVLIESANRVNILANDGILLENDGDTVLSVHKVQNSQDWDTSLECTGKLTLSSGAGYVDVDDLITLVQWFKTNNTAINGGGPFAS